MTDVILSIKQAEANLQQKVKRMTRKPERLAEQLMKVEEKIKFHAIKTIEYYVEAGVLLIAAKEKLPHGSWGEFLQNVGLSQPSASRRMTLATYYEALPPTQPDGDPWDQASASKAIKALKDGNPLLALSAPDFSDLENPADLMDKDKDGQDVTSRPKMGEASRIKQKAVRLVADMRLSIYQDHEVMEVVEHARHELESLLNEYQDYLDSE